MSPFFLLRLTLDLVAVGLFMGAMAYWWLDNRTHELIGTAMFGLLILHNVFNRRWYGTLPRTRREAKPLMTVVLNLILLATMVTLLTTSVLISQSVFGVLSVGGATAREIHILAAYWALIIISIHLGLHWSIVMNVGRGLTGLREHSALRACVLRFMALGMAAQGVYSSFEMNIGSRLLLVPTMQFWDFNEGSFGFFLCHASIVGLYVCIGYYAMAALQSWKKRSQSTRRPSQDEGQSIHA
jgi:hypothetical protein